MILAAQISIIVLIVVFLLGAAGFAGAVDIISEGEAE